MARLWQSGFELNDVTANVEWTAVTNSPTIQSSIVRSGSYALQCNVSATTAYLSYTFATAGNNDFAFRFYLYIDSSTNALDTIFQVIDNGVGGTSFSVKLNSNRTLELWDENADLAPVQIGSDSSALRPGEWYRIEINYNWTATSAFTLTGYLNGVQWATGDVTGNVADQIDIMRLGCVTSTTANLYFDDVAINDTAGSFQNSLPGAGKIIHLRPDAAGDTDAWDLTTTFEDIDEVTPDDATTLISSLTAEDIHEVNLDATPNLISSNDTINVVAVGVRFNESIGTDPDPIFVLRIKSTSGGTVEESGNITASSTTWFTNAISAPRNYRLVLYDLPGASTTAWAKSNLDTTQIGVRLTNSPVGLAQVSTLWLSVDYTPVERAVGIKPPYRDRLIFSYLP